MNSTVSATSSPPLVTVMAGAVFVSVLTGSMVNVVLPQLRQALGATTGDIGWVVTAYSLAYAVAVPLYGRLADTFGLRFVFISGVTGFALGGLLCALAPSLPLLVAGRLVQGLGGAAIPALASIAITQNAPPGNRGAGLGIIATSLGVGSAIGPVIGGFVGQLVGWRALFLGSVTLALLIIFAAIRTLPTGKGQAQPVDLLGGALLGMSTGLLLFGLSQASKLGFTAIPAWASLLGAVLSAGGLIWRSLHTSNPFIPSHLLGHRSFLAVMGVGFLASFVNLSALVLVPLLLIEIQGVSPALAGLALTPGAVALALLSPLAGRISDRLAGLTVVRFGLIVMILALTILALLAGRSPYWLAFGMLLLGTGFASVQAPVNNAASKTLAERDLAVGMGLFTAAFFLGSGAGPTLSGALLAYLSTNDHFTLMPFVTGPAAAYSATFLFLVLVLIMAILISLRDHYTIPK